MLRSLGLGLLVLGMTIVATVSLLLVQRRNPPNATMIVYQVHEDGHWRPYIMAADGTNQQSLEDYFNIKLPNGDFTVLRWSPDRRWIVTTLYDGIRTNIYRMRVSDGYMDALTKDDFNIIPIWTPDGRSVVYTRYTNNQNDTIRRLHVAGGHVETLTPPALDASGAVPSPDGGWIAFISTSEDSPGLYRMRHDGTQLDLLVGGEHFNRTAAAYDAPAWSPDGRWIAFTFQGRLYKVRADGSDIQALNDSTTYALGMVTWSPDAQWIAFTVINKESYDIFRIHSDGTALEQLTFDLSNEVHPHYAPVIERPLAGGWLLGLGMLILVATIGSYRMGYNPVK